MFELVKYHTERNDESCKRVALVQESTKYIHVLPLCVSGQGRMTLWKVPKSDRAFMTPLLLRGKPYPTTRALNGFRRMARTYGITKSAKVFLREVSRENKKSKMADAETS